MLSLFIEFQHAVWVWEEATEGVNLVQIISGALLLFFLLFFYFRFLAAHHRDFLTFLTDMSSHSRGKKAEDTLKYFSY